MTEISEEYLGDGLYASFDGFQICLRAPRENGDHVVYLEPVVYDALRRFVDGVRNRPPGHGGIMTEQEREIVAREECKRRGLDPDDDAADGVAVWMVVDQELRQEIERKATKVTT